MVQVIKLVCGSIGSACFTP
ncbi:hypothetical protein DU976_21190 [Vibrio navarrensis]|uniref:Uncharacterized protein n=1 Tax=Vibrio navarrensis TaxID=29495 RepID=A0AAI9CYQ2_9VIBR|nr:DUF3265 domain-containing protein [Vibrio parahaemolyticus]EGR2798310.1 hypothetical protein [Vibrio navarrensis]ELN6934666.1 hypothetical protein [Vibrio navarrensis]